VAVRGIVLGLTVSASAEPILRLVTFTVADPDKQDQVFQLASWPATPIKCTLPPRAANRSSSSYDPATGQNVGVSLWDSQVDMEAVTQTDAFQIFLEKLKPLKMA
jgi:hypothetical protein